MYNLINNKNKKCPKCNLLKNKNEFSLKKYKTKMGVKTYINTYCKKCVADEAKKKYKIRKLKCQNCGGKKNEITNINNKKTIYKCDKCDNNTNINNYKKQIIIIEKEISKNKKELKRLKEIINPYIVKI